MDLNQVWPIVAFTVIGFVGCILVLCVLDVLSASGVVRGVPRVLEPTRVHADIGKAEK